MTYRVQDGVRVLGAVLFGIILTYVWGSATGVIALFACAGVFTFALYRIGWRTSMKLFFVIIFAVTVGYAWAYHYEVIRMHEDMCPKSRSTAVGTVVGFRDGAKGRTPIVRPDGMRTKLLVHADGTLPRGAIVKVSGSCKPPEAFVSDTGREVPYDQMLWARGVTHQMYANDVEVLRLRGGRFWIMRGLDRARDAIVKTLDRSLSPGNASLAGGLLVGLKQGTPQSDSDAFKAAGLTHIVVLSGYNITLIARLVMRLVASFAGFWSRRVLALLAVVAIVVLSGAEPPAVRAGVMGALAVGAAMAGRKQAAIWMFMLATTVLAVVNPRSVLFDVSFQLSIAATIGVIFLAPKLQETFSRVTERFGLRSLVAETLSATILTLPIIWYAIGTWPLLGILMNLIVVPFVPLATLLSAATGILGLISTNLGFMVGSASSVVLGGIRGAARLASHAQFSIIQLPQIPGWLTAVLFTIVCAVLILRSNSPKTENLTRPL